MLNQDKHFPFPIVVSALVLLGGCATSNAPVEENGAAQRQLSSIARALPGRYASVVENDAPERILTIERRSGRQPDVLAFEMTQRGQDGSLRRFGLTLEPGATPLVLEGSFAPLGEDGGARGRCGMQFHLREGGLVGRTNERECRFESDGSATGLLKELAFDGRNLVIGDRLVDLDDDSVLGEQTLSFLPAATFDTRVGQREGSAWRVSGEVGLVTGGPAVVPEDAAGMKLGIELSLDYFRAGDEGPALLRLSLRESASGTSIAYAWADARAARIGLNLPDFQVAAERVNQP